MRSPGSVFKKLKEVKYRHLTLFYKKYFKKIPENCKYNYKYEFMSDGQKKQIRLCLLHQENTDSLVGLDLKFIDVCEQMHHCSRCDAFIFRYTKEDIKSIFEEELSNQSIKEKKYPEICALEWVLEKSVAGTLLISWPQVLYYYIKRVLLRNKLL